MAFATALLTLAISNGDVILIVALVAIPVAGIAFVVGAGGAFDQIGKGGLSLELESDMPKGLRDSDAESGSSEVADEEVRQMLEAKAHRQAARGEQPLDVEAEFERLQTEQRASGPAANDAGLREEVRQLVVARNERRKRQGKPPLDIEAEIVRQLRELESLGQ